MINTGFLYHDEIAGVIFDIVMNERSLLQETWSLFS